MKLSERIRKEAVEKGASVNTSGNMEFEKFLNQLFYLPKKPKEELKFLESVMTRGADTQERSGLHMSNLLESENKFCFRAMVLSLFYHQLQGSNVEVGLKRIFEEGDSIHQKWQRLFIRAGWCDYKDLDYTRFDSNYDVSYTPDAILHIPTEKEAKKVGAIGSDKFCGDWVVEIKSVNTYQFQKMKSHPKGKTQCEMYMYKEDIQRGIVLCEDKNTQDFKVYIYHLKDANLNTYISRMEQIQYYKDRVVEKNKMVARREDCTSPTCKLCSECVMRDACWNVGEGRKRL